MVIEMDHFYVTSNLTQEKTAWSKAAADVEYFLNSAGFHPISVERCAICTESYLPEMISPEKEGIILIQYPRILLEGFNLPWFLSYVKTYYGNYKLAALVHDLDSIRFGNFFETGVLAEVPLLNQFDYLITVNDAMLAVLKEHGAKPKLIPMTIFDYALDQSRPAAAKRKYPKVAFAGNLKYSKSRFLYDLNKIDLKNTIIDLYGPYLDTGKFQQTDHICYKGEFSSESLPDAIDDDFGLCWDGNCIDRCCGKNCEYFRFSNPHKVSFYLAMRMPVIVSKEISTASFLEKEHAGITIGSLHELPDALNRVTAKEYQALQKNCARISEKLRSGYYLKLAVRKIEEDIRKVTQ